MIHTALRAVMPTTYLNTWLSRRALRRLIARAELPRPVTDLIADVCARTHLRRSEQLDVARELTAHFQSGLESGASMEDVIAAFGDPKRAARSIARAKRAARHPTIRYLQHAILAVVLLSTSVVLFYAFTLYRYYAGEPNVTRNYLAEIRAPVLAIPDQDRAWPLYVRAIQEFGAIPREIARDGFAAGPGAQTWPFIRKYLAAHTQGLATLREAAGKPVLGFDYADLSWQKAAMRARSPEHPPGMDVPIADNPIVVSILLPHLHELRNAARILAADARIAAEDEDKQRYLANLEAIFGISRQLMSEPFTLSHLVALAVAELAMSVAREQVATDLLGDADLARLASGVARSPARASPGGMIILDLESERVIVEDILQRIFTDDGRGGGRLIEGELGDIERQFGVALPHPLARNGIFPLRALAVASRRKLQDQLDLAMAAAERDQRRPLSAHAQRSCDEEFAKLTDLGLDLAFPIYASMREGDGWAGSLFLTRDHVEAHRAALLTAIAAKRHQLATGAWPTALDQLVPRYLAQAPPDPLDPRSPLRIRTTKDALVIYSAGINKTDDNAQGINDRWLAPPNPGSQTFYDAGTLELWLDNPSTAPQQDDWILILLPN